MNSTLLIRHTSLGFEPVTIPAGVPVHSMGTGKWHTSKRKRTVKPFSVKDYDEWRIVTWPGSGGYWQRVVLRDGVYVASWPFSGKPTWDKIDAMDGERL